MSVLAAPAFIAVTLPLAWRRIAPLQAAGAVLGALVLHTLAFGEMVRCGIMIPPTMVLAFAAAARLGWRDALGGLGLSWLIMLVVLLGESGNGAPMDAAWFLALVTAAAWGVGRLVHARGRMVEELRARTSELRAARDARTQLEVATDRARLSGELDELLQRRLGDLARLAEARAPGGDVAATTATLVDIERESRRTLEEMRAVVGALRNDHSDVPLAPQPALTQLEALLVHAKGGDARLTVEGSPRTLPPGVELSAYRILEHLLDALGDAPDVEVRVRFAADALELAVTGPARRRGEEAIERARERVALHHGTLRATTLGGRAEAVVSLPVLAAS